MPDYAPTYTPRLHWLYSCQGKNHLATFRFQVTNTFAEAAGFVEEVATALQPFYSAVGYADLATRGWEWAENNSTVFLPISTAVEVHGEVSTTGRPINQVAMQATLPYRTAAGGKGFLNFYGTNFNVYGSDEQDFRIFASEAAVVSDLIDALAPIGFVGGDNEVVSFKPYINIGLNARWKRKVRNG